MFRHNPVFGIWEIKPQIDGLFGLVSVMKATAGSIHIKISVQGDFSPLNGTCIVVWKGNTADARSDQHQGRDAIRIGQGEIKGHLPPIR